MLFNTLPSLRSLFTIPGLRLHRSDSEKVPHQTPSFHRYLKCPSISYWQDSEARKKHTKNATLQMHSRT